MIGVDHFFDEDEAGFLLDVGGPVSLVKSLYGFDISTRDGVRAILDLIDIFDVSVVQDLSKFIWPSFTEIDAELTRQQVKGFLIDLYRGFPNADT